MGVVTVLVTAVGLLEPLVALVLVVVVEVVLGNGQRRGQPRTFA